MSESELVALAFRSILARIPVTVALLGTATP
jgi:hypothetical protein